MADAGRLDMPMLTQLLSEPFVLGKGRRHLPNKSVDFAGEVGVRTGCQQIPYDAPPLFYERTRFKQMRFDGFRYMVAIEKRVRNSSHPLIHVR